MCKFTTYTLIYGWHATPMPRRCCESVLYPSSNCMRITQFKLKIIVHSNIHLCLDCAGSTYLVRTALGQDQLCSGVSVINPRLAEISSTMQQPTLRNVRIRSTRDAIAVFHGVARNILPLITFVFELCWSTLAESP
jgi:hypothetical protein